MQPHKRNWLQWFLMLAGWFLLTFGIFFLSEKCKDIDLIVYPSVFILIASMLLGPGTLCFLLPASENETVENLRPVMPYLLYLVCWGTVAVLARLCFYLHVL